MKHSLESDSAFEKLISVVQRVIDLPGGEGGGRRSEMLKALTRCVGVEMTWNRKVDTR